MHRRFHLFLIAAIAGSAIAPSELRAGPVGGQIGHVSRASIGINLSVAPRMGIYTRSSPQGRIAAQSFCVWSSGASRIFTATLQDAVAGHYLTSYTTEETSAIPLESGNFFESTASSSATECRSGDHHGDILLSGVRNQIGEAPGRALLILAPE